MCRFLSACCVMAIALTVAKAGEEKVPLDKVPKALMDAVKTRFPDAKVMSASKENDEGKTVFEITIKNKGQNIDVSLTPEGKITTIEKEVSFKDLPKAVKRTLEVKYPKAKYKIVEEIFHVFHVKDGKETLEYYEALLVNKAGVTLEAEVAPDGKFLKQVFKNKTDSEEGEGDEKVPLDKVPVKILDAVKAKYPKAKILSAEKGDVDGTKVYEFELELGKKKWEASFTPDGKFFGSEEIITELPAKVKEAFDKKFPDVKITRMEKETTGEGDNAKIVYEILVERGTDRFEIQYDGDAKFLSEKKLKPAKK